MSDSLRAAMTRRLLRRAIVSGSITLPAVPDMLDEYVDMCDDIFVGIGVPFTGAELAQLREVIEGQLIEAFAMSPRSEIVITYESPVGLTVNYRVHAHWSDLGSAYDNWVATRTPPLFGSEPDARVLSLAVAAGDPAACPVLDIGAGTGRNAITLAQRGHEVDCVELSSQFAAALREQAERGSLPLRVIERDVFESADDLRDDYRLVVLSEVTSDFRSAAELRAAFEVAAAHLAPGGHFVTNVFVTRNGYTPDDAARQLAQQTYSAMFTRDEVAEAVAGLGLELEADDSVYDFEKAHLPGPAWPPTGWYEGWVSGQDVFDVPRTETPIEMRWLVYRKQ